MPDEKRWAGHDVMLRGGGHARARSERHREMQLRVIFDSRARRRAGRRRRRCQARANPRPGRCRSAATQPANECRPPRPTTSRAAIVRSRRAFGEDARHPRTIEEDAQTASRRRSSRFGRAPRLRRQGNSARRAGAFVVLAKRRRRSPSSVLDIRMRRAAPRAASACSMRCMSEPAARQAAAPDRPHPARPRLVTVVGHRW